MTPEPLPESSSTGERLMNSVLDRAKLIAGIVALFWGVEVLDSLILSDRLEANGIQPRSIGGLDGVLWAPFLHGGFGHLIANTIPFVLLAGLTMALGLRRFALASAIIIVVGGLAVWLFAIGSNENHIGASGWIFGLFGFLVSVAIFEHRIRSIALAFIALVLYGTTLLFGLIPAPGRSWEGHLFGLLAGVLAGWLLTKWNQSQLEPPNIAGT